LLTSLPTDPGESGDPSESGDRSKSNDSGLDTFGGDSTLDLGRMLRFKKMFFCQKNAQNWLF
jgi:hypothetical protein